MVFVTSTTSNTTTVTILASSNNNNNSTENNSILLAIHKIALRVALDPINARIVWVYCTDGKMHPTSVVLIDNDVVIWSNNIILPPKKRQ